MFAIGYSSKMKESFFCNATFVEYLYVYNISIVFQSMVIAKAVPIIFFKSLCSSSGALQQIIFQIHLYYMPVPVRLLRV